MFPSKQLISYVFADPADEYRGGDLLSLNLKQYLWKSLHQQYKTVYFLRSSNGCSFRVDTFHEQNATRPGSPMFWQSHEDVFGKWLVNQLRQGAAFVCPMDEFCQVFSRPVWMPVLKEIAKESRRTGIFVLTASPYAEDSRKYLLDSPVFKLLQEHTVINNRGCNQSVYNAIRAEKPEHLCFLNAFTPERISDLLLNICAGDPDRYLNTEKRLALAGDLAARLQSGQYIPGQQGSALPARYQSYRWLYEQLCTQSGWDRLTAPDRVLLTYPNSPELPILHGPSSCVGKCLTLQLPAWVLDKRDSGGKSPVDVLREIHELVDTPGNSPENTELANAAFSFMKQLQELDTDDIDTCVLLLDALRFCIKWLHIHREDSKYDEVARILNGLKVSTADSAACFRGNRELSAREADSFATGQEWLALVNSRKKLNEKMNMLHNYVSLLRANIFTLETSGYIDSRVLMDVFVKEMQKTDTDEFVLHKEPQSGYTPYYPNY